MVFGARWSEETMVWVADWGHVVHNSPTCSGIGAFGSSDRSAKVRLDDRRCAVRRACKKCFGEFYGEGSLRVLDRLIERLHGRVDLDQPARTLIATTARLRFGDASARPPTKASAATSQKPSPRSVITSQGRTKPAKAKTPKGGAARPKPKKMSPTTKAEEKRKLDQAAAERLGITVNQLRARRRAKHEAHIAAKAAASQPSRPAGGGG